MDGVGEVLCGCVVDDSFDGLWVRLNDVGWVCVGVGMFDYVYVTNFLSEGW